MTPSPALRRVLRGDLCAGCGGCTMAAPGQIVMEIDAAGFLRPRQTAAFSATEEREVTRICPGLRLELGAAGRSDDVLWGPLIAIRMGHATDQALRRTASSGGALSAMLIHLLETGAVDRVVQTAASATQPIGNAIVESRSAAQVFAAAGSRYAPSAPLEGLAAALDSPERAAFVGKPCDVAALRALAQRDPRVDAAFPYMISFFCAGVPSLAGAREVLTKLRVAEADIAAFRYRGDGWPGRATATLRNGDRVSMSYAESWGNVLSRHLQLRCKICPDGVGGFADVVCADAWRCDEQGYPLFEEADGLSLLISRTVKGEVLVRDALAANRLVAEPLDAAAIAPMQPGQVKRKQMALARLAALLIAFRPTPRFKGFNLRAAARRAHPAAHLRNFLGTLRRLVVDRWLQSTKARK